MEHNHITHIQDNVFKDLNKLTSLNIEHNKIANISDNAFVGLESKLYYYIIFYFKQVLLTPKRCPIQKASDGYVIV